LHTQSTAEGQARQSNWSDCGATVANTNLVLSPNDYASATTHTSQTIPKTINPTNAAIGETSLAQENCVSCMSDIRRKLSEQGHSNLTIDIILASWRDSTKSQYQSSLNKWLDFCIKKDVDIISPSVAEAMAFLTFLYESNLSYSSINTARSALSSFLQLESSTPFGQLAIVKRFMKGIYELRPCFPRHNSVWNVTTVFDYFRK